MCGTKVHCIAVQYPHPACFPIWGTPSLIVKALQTESQKHVWLYPFHRVWDVHTCVEIVQSCLRDNISGEEDEEEGQGG